MCLHFKAYPELISFVSSLMDHNGFPLQYVCSSHQKQWTVRPKIIYYSRKLQSPHFIAWMKSQCRSLWNPCVCVYDSEMRFQDYFTSLLICIKWPNQSNFAWWCQLTNQSFLMLISLGVADFLCPKPASFMPLLFINLCLPCKANSWRDGMSSMGWLLLPLWERRPQERHTQIKRPQLTAKNTQAATSILWSNSSCLTAR